MTDIAAGYADRMRVSDCMRRQSRVCSPGHNLATTGRIMAEARCGLLPVLDGDDRVVGVITDRDICVALAQRDRRASEVWVREIVRPELFSCRADEDVRQALATIRQRRVRRLPVLDEAGRLEGLLVLEDLIPESLPSDSSAEKREEALPCRELLATLKSIQCPGV